MSYFEKISKRDLVNVLCKNWLTHDAMWISLIVDSIGIEKSNIINRKAVRSMARIEAKRLLKLYNISKIQNISQLVDFLKNTYELVAQDIIIGEFIVIGEDTLRFDTKKCFAFEGISKIGQIEKYECGIFERIEGWFDTLQIDFLRTPENELCLMHHSGSCIKEYKLKFLA